VTRALHNAFFDIVNGKAEDKYHWLTPVKVREAVTA
jgi:branched-chain amino acid aminotransferase